MDSASEPRVRVRRLGSCRPGPGKLAWTQIPSLSRGWTRRSRPAARAMGAGKPRPGPHVAPAASLRVRHRLT